MLLVVVVSGAVSRTHFAHPLFAETIRAGRVYHPRIGVSSGALVGGGGDHIGSGMGHRTPFVGSFMRIFQNKTPAWAGWGEKRSGAETLQERFPNKRRQPTKPSKVRGRTSMLVSSGTLLPTSPRVLLAAIRKLSMAA